MMSYKPVLPLKHDLASAYTLSLTVAVLMAAASLAGLSLATTLYPTVELRQSFLANDVVNLFIALPMLVGAMIAARRGSLLGLLFWPGALLYVTYNYTAYAVAVLPALQSIAYLSMAILSAYTVVLLFGRMDAPAIRDRLAGRVPVRLAAGVLVGLGGLFFLRAVAQIAGAMTSQQALAKPEVGVLVADLLITPFWIVGGILLWRKHPIGYASGAGLLFQASMLFVGLLVFFILQPVLAGMPFPIQDFAVVAVMGLVCFIPFGLFVRGAISGGNA